MEESRQTVFDQLAVFVHRKWLFIVPLVIGIAGGIAASVTLPEKFSSTTLIVVEEQQVPEEYVTPADRTPFAQRLNVISQQILSRTRLEKIIREFGLNYEGPGLVARARSLVTGEAVEAPTPDEIIEQMRSDIAFTVVGEQPSRRQQNATGGNAFTITYSGEAPETTMQVTNTLASLFIEENLRVREQYAEGTSEFLTSELEGAQHEIQGLEGRLKEFKQANMGTLPAQLDANLRTLDRLQLDLQTVTANLRNNEDRRAVLEEQMKYGAPVAVAPAVRSSIAVELDGARASLGEMLSMFKENYPDVIIMKKRIRDLERQLQGEMATGGEELDPEEGPSTPDVLKPAYAELMAVRSQITTLRQRESNIRKQIDEYARRVELTPVSEQQLADLQRDYDISLRNYQALLEKKMSAKLAENLEKRQKGVRFRVVDPANLPQGPNQPNKPLVMGIGAAAGAFVGIGLVFMVEFLNPAFRKPEDFDGMIDAPVLTSVPLFPDEEAAKPEARLTVIKGRKQSA